ncbi:HAD family hydrolase [Clostridium sp. P21]|uniref:HAD family hydrolase n=1 Tax=Clostridium muellerianum TaxID=2716538 RepID=A0A7Y0EKK2_9CLOT|nr:HAD family hydrolase [Clostridium muellerianum]NMM65198.1 HAD family hydrolase [Clostridium muellerianum]
MSKIRGFLFDKDGTILDFNSMWIPVAEELANEICNDLIDFSKLNIKEELLQSIGIVHGKVDSTGVYAHGTAEEIAEEFIKVFNRFNINYGDVENSKKCIVDKYNKIARDNNRKVIPAANLKMVFENLKKQGMYIGVSTADTEESTESCLKKLGVYHYFDFIGTDNGKFKSKPHPDLLNEFCKIYKLKPHEVAVVGDTKIDMMFAKNGKAGHAIGVLSGVGSAEELNKLADVIYPSIEYLIEYCFQ